VRYNPAFLGRRKAARLGQGANDESTRELTQAGQFQALDRRLLEILDSDARIPMISKHGAFYYNLWRDAKNRRGIWRRTTLEKYRKPRPAWEVVLDLDALAKHEKENWVWRGAQFLKPENCPRRFSPARRSSPANGPAGCPWPRRAS